MAQAGLLVPADAGSSFTPFRTVFADIGDAQSIAASLSTFSAHITRLVHVERALELPALVLLDEVGSGTDPLEGGALGAAVIDHFRRRGALVVATTHDDALKSYASTTPGVMTAGFGFKPETYAPTYRLMYGAPGRSLALEIAERLGMPARRHRRRPRATDGPGVAAGRAPRAARPARLRAARTTGRQLEAERAPVATERTRLLEREAHLAEREAVLKRRLDDRLNEKLREARTEVDRIVGRSASARACWPSRPSNAPPRATRCRPATSAASGPTRARPWSRWPRPSPSTQPADTRRAHRRRPAVGDTVFVASLNATASCAGVRASRSRWTFAANACGPGRRTCAGRSAAPPKDAAATATRTARVSRQPPARGEGPTRDLVLVGCTVDDALDRAGKFLDDALLADERRVRVVHGHGTGRLRDALATFFRDHPLVAACRTADEREGGAGPPSWS